MVEFEFGGDHLDAVHATGLNGFNSTIDDSLRRSTHCSQWMPYTRVNVHFLGKVNREMSVVFCAFNVFDEGIVC